MEKVCTINLNTAKGVLNIVEDSDWGHTGKNPLIIDKTIQRMTMDVDLKPNTEYKISFWYGYTLPDDEKDVYLAKIGYGIYYPDEETQTLKKPLSGGIYETRKVNSSTRAMDKVWKKATLSFITNDNTDNFVFSLFYDDKIKNASTIKPNKITLYIDDFAIWLSENAPANANITIDCKDAASVDVVSGYIGDFTVGDKVGFKVRTKEELVPVVEVNGAKLVADENGIYYFTATEKDLIKVECAGDEKRRDGGADIYGNDLTRYNEKIASYPFWEGDTVYHETAIFYSERNEIKLLYPISEVISVRSYDLSLNYLEGIDYEITNEGTIKILEGSKIPIFTDPLTTNVENSFPVVDEENTYIAFIDDYVYPAYAINVTYRHTTRWEDGYTPYHIESVAKDIPNVFKKLQNGEEVNIVIFGDSASCGWSSSGLKYIDKIYSRQNVLGTSALNFPPFTPPWMDMFESNLKKLYPKAKINFKNLAVGGTRSRWGYISLAERLKLLGEDWKTDLLVCAFGGNDLTAGIAPEEFYESMQKIINVFRDPNTQGVSEDAEILLWTEYIFNTKAVQYTLEKTLEYQAEYKKLIKANKGVALVDTLQEFYEMFKTKDVMDILNTNVNHGNDFLTRVIAQGIISAFK